MTLAPERIREQLQRLLDHPELSRSPRSLRLLTFLVEEVLAGREDSLKAYTIGLEVFDRPDDFDPQLDSIVRVQAGRLRRLLENYYLTAGAQDPVIFTMPAGSYVIQFAERPGAETQPNDAASPLPVGETNRSDMVALEKTVPAMPSRQRPRLASSFWRRRRTLYGLLILLPLLAFGAGVVWTSHKGFDQAIESALNSEIPLPVLQVNRFNTLGAMPEQSAWGDDLATRVASELSSFRSVRVVGPVFGVANRNDVDVPEFVLGGVLQFGDETLDVTVQLTRSRTGDTVWSQTYSRHYGARDFSSIQKEVASRVAARLGENYGVISRAVVAETSKMAGGGYKSYACVLRFMEYGRDKTEEEHAKVRDCLQSAIKRDPDYADAWSALSWIYGDELRFGFNPQPHAGRRSIDAALKATRIAPGNAVAARFLSVAYFANGFRTLADRESARSLELNPNDPEVLAEAGTLLVFSNRIESGQKLLKKAISLSPAYPPWFLEGLIIAALIEGRQNEALSLAEQGLQPKSPMSQTLLAAAQSALGKTEEARATLARLAELKPDYSRRPMDSFTPWGVDPAIIQKIGALLPASR